jgi:hypothetical protein
MFDTDAADLFERYDAREAAYLDHARAILAEEEL